MQKWSAFIAIAIVVFLNGCANWSSVYRKKSLSDDVTVVSVDAKQRFLLSAAARDDSGVYQHFRKLCAEPSPDVFSAFAAALEGSAQTEAFEAALKASFSENAATIGLRTQAIQLLRDGMYRICEGMMNKSIDQDDFMTLHQRYQRIMVTLVAIEQLTGAVAPPSVAIETSSYTGGPARLPGLQDALKQAKEQLGESEETLASESGATYAEDADGDGEDQDLKCLEFDGEVDERPTECEDYFAATDDVTEKKESVQSLEKQIDAAQEEIITSASGNVTFLREPGRGIVLSDVSVESVTSTIQQMVNQLFNVDFDTALRAIKTYDCPNIRGQAEALKQAGESIQNISDQYALLENRNAIRFTRDVPDTNARYLSPSERAEVYTKDQICSALLDVIRPK